MSLASFFLLYKQKALIPVMGAIVGLVLGLGLYFLLPVKYIASGSMFVVRQVEEVPTEFNYEGYYSSLSSFNYTQSLAALLETDDIRGGVLRRLDLPVTKENLKNLKKSVDVKKTTTQVLTFVTKDTNPKQATAIWKAYAQELKTVTTRVNQFGDSGLIPVQLIASPVVYQGFSNIFVSGLAGVFLGFFLGSFIISIYIFIKAAK